MKFQFQNGASCGLFVKINGQNRYILVVVVIFNGSVVSTLGLLCKN